MCYPDNQFSFAKLIPYNTYLKLNFDCDTITWYKAAPLLQPLIIPTQGMYLGRNQIVKQGSKLSVSITGGRKLRCLKVITRKLAQVMGIAVCLYTMPQSGRGYCINTLISNQFLAKFWSCLRRRTSPHCWPPYFPHCAQEQLKQVTTFDDMWRVVLACDNLWQLVRNCDNMWQFVTTFYKLWQFVTS